MICVPGWRMDFVQGAIAPYCKKCAKVVPLLCVMLCRNDESKKVFPYRMIAIDSIGRLGIFLLDRPGRLVKRVTFLLAVLSGSATRGFPKGLFRRLVIRS